MSEEISTKAWTQLEHKYGSHLKTLHEDAKVLFRAIYGTVPGSMEADIVIRLMRMLQAHRHLYP